MEAIKTKGLNSFQLKLIALVLMTFDHIYEFFSYTGNIPIVFKWTGRIVAPIFMFLIVEGYIHTRSKNKYMLKLYVGSLIMSIGSFIMSKYLPRADGFIINNNIFATFLMMIIYMIIVDYLKKSVYEKNTIKILSSALFLIMPFVVGSAVIAIADVSNLSILQYIIPNIYLVEGGPILVALGLIFYLTKDNLYKLIQSYIIFSISILMGSALEGSFNVKQIFMENYQWMMIFSIPFFKLYNGEKGIGFKYLFYIFYPTHIFLLYIASYLLIG